MRINIPRPESEKESVNLFDTVITAIKAIDMELPNYFLEANIMDDKSIEEIIELLNAYYTSTRNLSLALTHSDRKNWELTLTDKKVPE
ncbi:hypothetical protein [Limnobaculum parvum]|uniref:Uncharacterized protein n=1 Tax=Limnobaculum parvum TaxID=2172103 RepID=A0A2Y9TVN7_9GAMM|nr:hypothetical protein [Limnobaculum parvum]AWH87765.1 hypothetical protein HYN51_03830 [Limnobaculum parvum]